MTSSGYILLHLSFVVSNKVDIMFYRAESRLTLPQYDQTAANSLAPWGRLAYRIALRSSKKD